jgi:hypothetical protein
VFDSEIIIELVKTQCESITMGFVQILR